METKELKGLFLMGSLRNGATFLGICDDIDSTRLYLSFKGSKKWVLLSEVVELKAEEYNPNKEVSE